MKQWTRSVGRNTKLSSLRGYQSETWVRKYSPKWYNGATHSRLKPIIEKAKMLKRRRCNILIYAKHHITNAVSGGLNSKIQWGKASARGFHNFDNFTTAIYFHCGRLILKSRRL